MKIDWVRKLTSRKFWLSVSGFVSMMMIFFHFSESEATQVAALIVAGADVIAYVIGEGLADSGGTAVDLIAEEITEEVEHD